MGNEVWISVCTLMDSFPMLVGKPPARKSKAKKAERADDEDALDDVW